MAKTGFTRKKVSTLTLGERLRDLRSSFRMSLSEVSRATRIQVKYLEYLENGEYDKLPADVYTRGFVRSYARHLNADEQAILKMYDRERHIESNLRPEKAKTLREPLSRFSLVITPRSILLVGVALLIVGAFAYLYGEFRSFASAPYLVILEPGSGSVVEKSEVTVRGQTERGARVIINNQPAFVGADGAFEETLFLQPGLNTVTVVALNRLEKEKREVLSLEARYALPPVLDVPSAETFTLAVEGRGRDVELILEADGARIFEGLLGAGEQREVTARERVRLVTNDPSATWVTFQGGEPEVVGAGGLLEVVYTAQGREGQAEAPPAEAPGTASPPAPEDL